MSTEDFDLERFVQEEYEAYAGEKTQEEDDSTHVYFNEKNYYLHFVEESGVTIWSECCGDTLDLESAIVLRDRLNRWIEKQS